MAEVRTDDLAGLSLSAALDLLRERGLPIVYSSENVAASMRVESAPTGGDAGEILDQLLAPHGLAATRGPQGRWLIVRRSGLGRIEGSVRSSTSGEPLADVAVRLPALHLVVRSDGDGRFVTPVLSPGRYTLKAGLSGYFPLRLEDVEIVAGTTGRLLLDLVPVRPLSETVLVSARRGGRAPDETGDAVHLGAEELESQPGLGHDVLRRLGPVAGVTESEQTAQVNLRGGVDDEVAVVLDGLELYEPFHLQERRGLISVIDASTVGDLAVLGGGLPAEYGGRMSGVIDITTVEPDGPARTTVAGSNEGYRLSTKQQTAGGTQWLVSGRYGTPQTVLDALGVDPGYSPLYYDLFGKLRLPLSDRLAITFNLLGAQDDLEGEADQASIGNGGTLDSRSAQRYGWIGLEARVGPGIFSRTLLSLGRIHHERLGSDARIEQLIDRRITEIYGLRQDWAWSGKRQLLKWGFDVKSVHASYDYVFEPSQPRGPQPVDLVLVPSGVESALYVSDLVRLHPAVDLELGVRRSDRTYAPEDGNVAPRVNLLARIGDRIRLRASWGYVYQPQRINELQVEDGISTFYRAQRAEHRSVGLDVELPRGIEMSTSFYDKLGSWLRPRHENLFDPYVFFPEAAADRVLIVPERSRSRGVEWSLGRPRTRTVGWWVNYAWASASDRESGHDVRRAWDIRHRLRWGVDLRLGKSWQLSWTGSHSSGRPITDVAYVETPEPGSGQEPMVVLGPRNEGILPPYHRVDARLSYHVAVKRSDLALDVGVANLFDRRNVCCVNGYDVEVNPDGGTEVVRLDVPGLRRVLTYGLRWSF